MKRISLLIWVALLVSTSAQASLRTTWKAFCERRLVSEAPAPGPDPRFLFSLTKLQDEAQSPEAFADRVVDEYRRIGGKIYWLSLRRQPTDLDQIRKNDLQKYLKFLGREMRTLHSPPDPVLTQKIDDAFFDYQRFEPLHGSKPALRALDERSG